MAAPGGHRRPQPLHPFSSRQVGLDRPHLGPTPGQTGLRLRQLVVLGIEDHIEPVLHELPGQLQPNPTRRPRHQRQLPHPSTTLLVGSHPGVGATTPTRSGNQPRPATTPGAERQRSLMRFLCDERMLPSNEEGGRVTVDASEAFALFFQNNRGPEYFGRCSPARSTGPRPRNATAEALGAKPT